MKFNISTKQVNDTSILHLRDPETDTLMYADEAETQPLQIVMYGKGSKQYRDALSGLARKNMIRKNKQQSFETNVADNVEILAAISKVAVNFDQDGVAIDNTDEFKKLYSNPSLFWVKEQIQEQLDDTAAFLQK